MVKKTAADTLMCLTYICLRQKDEIFLSIIVSFKYFATDGIDNKGVNTLNLNS